MMQKLMSYKKIIICACAAVAVIAVAAIVLLSKKEETFRSILVYDVEGKAVIERENVGAMNATENLYLESGDRVSVASDSGLRLKLDDDKYVLAEADTVFSVEAVGTDANSKTKICLEQGAITNEIQHPLSEGSSYETSTPNSVMAVRGTIYRVELYVDENGNQDTKLCCFQGKVETAPILPDGTSGEAVLVPAGSELTVYEDGTVGDVKDIAYDELPRQAVENLLNLMESGQSVTGITLEELTQLISEAEDVSKISESGQTEQSDTAEQSVAEEAASKSDTEKEADEQIHTKNDTAKNVPAQPAKKEQGAPEAKPSTPALQPPKPADSGSVDNGNTVGDDSQDENPGSDDDGSDKKKPDKPNKPNKPDKPDKPDEPDDPDNPDNPDEPDEPTDPTTYTVTFMYQGKVFATQTVKSGEAASAPLLVPAENGTWDFDFETKIKANTTISWKS